MNLISLQTLTWGTVAGAVAAALTLAVLQPITPAPDRFAAAQPNDALPLASEPTAADAAASATSGGIARPAVR